MALLRGHPSASRKSSGPPCVCSSNIVCAGHSVAMCKQGVVYRALGMVGGGRPCRAQCMPPLQPASVWRAAAACCDQATKTTALHYPAVCCCCRCRRSSRCRASAASMASHSGRSMRVTCTCCEEPAGMRAGLETGGAVCVMSVTACSYYTCATSPAYQNLTTPADL
jgi:hypothetical protein